MSRVGMPRRTLGANDNEATPVNWRRGLFRVWVLASAAWIMAWAVYLMLSGIRHGLEEPGDVMVIPVLFFGPPIALLLFGLAAGWAFRGFKSDNKSDNKNSGS